MEAPRAGLFSASKLGDIRFYEIACRADEGFDDDVRRVVGEEDGSRSTVEEQQWDITVTVSPRQLECRARVIIVHRRYRYLVDAASVYSFEGSSVADASESEVLHFAREEALVTLFPYLRAEIHQAAGKVRGSREVFSELTVEGAWKAFENARERSQGSD